MTAPQKDLDKNPNILSLTALDVFPGHMVNIHGAH